MDKRFVFSTLTLLLFNCVAIIVSLSSNHWVNKSEGIASGYTGLFKGCVKFLELKICKSIEDPPIELEIVKGLVIAALILSVVPIIFVFLKIFGFVSGPKWLNVGALMLAVSGVFLIGGIVLYVLRIYKNTDNDLGEDGWTLHVGFIFACVGVGVSFICAGLMKMMGPYMESETENVAV